MQATKFTAAKVDTSLGLVFGYAMVCKLADGSDYYDLQDEHIPEDVMLKSLCDFMLGERVMKDMHQGDPIGQVVFAFPMTTDIAKALGITVEKTGALVAMKPSDRGLLEKFASGEYTGFSIGGYVSY